MSSLDDKMKLKAEVLQKDLEHYRRLETWGSSLFLAAIALLGKQLIEWDGTNEVAHRVTLAPWAFSAPAAVGVVAFVFLRVVNFRGNRTTMALRSMVGESFPSTRTPWGVLALLLALMPWAFGHAVSWLLVHGDEARRAAASSIGLLGVIVALVGFGTHFVMRRRSCRG